MNFLLTGPYAPQWTKFPYSARLYLADNQSEQSYAVGFAPGRATHRFTLSEYPFGGGRRLLSGAFTLE